jgi:hypothetical protein
MQRDGARAVRRPPSSARRRVMETYLLMGFFICLFACLFLLIFFAVNAEERAAQPKKEKGPRPEQPVARRRHLHT